MNSNAIALAQLTEAALETIHNLTGFGGARAGEALAAIRGIIEKLREGATGTLQPQVVLAEIENLGSRLGVNDREAAHELDARFPK